MKLLTGPLLTWDDDDIRIIFGHVRFKGAHDCIRREVHLELRDLVKRSVEYDVWVRSTSNVRDNIEDQVLDERYTTPNVWARFTPQ